MIKNFRIGVANVFVKTNMLKKGICYFGEKDVEGNLTKYYREVKYDIPDLTSEQFLMEIFRRANKDGIKIYKIVFQDLECDGTNMVELTKQQVE